MSTFIDLVGGTTTTTGTGTYTLSGTVPWARSYTALSDATEYTYLVQWDDMTTSGYELVTGTYTSSGTTLTRDTVHYSSNSDAAVNWGAGTKRISIVAKSSMLNDISYDTTPTLGGDLDAGNQDIDNLKYLTWDVANHTLPTWVGSTYWMHIGGTASSAGGGAGAISSAIQFNPTIQMTGNHNFIALGWLFNNQATFNNEGATGAISVQQFPTVHASPQFKTVETTGSPLPAMTVTAHADLQSNAGFDGQQGALSVTLWNGFTQGGSVAGKATITLRVAYNIAQIAPTGNGVITTTVGLRDQGTYNATKRPNYTNYLMGSGSPPSGTHGIYQTDLNDFPHRWNASHRWAVHTESGTSLTLDDTHHVIECTNTSTLAISLPTAVGIAGREYIIKRMGTGSVTVNPDGSETIDGSSTTRTIVAQYNLMVIVSNGSNWMLLHEATP